MYLRSGPSIQRLRANSGSPNSRGLNLGSADLMAFSSTPPTPLPSQRTSPAGSSTRVHDKPVSASGYSFNESSARRSRPPSPVPSHWPPVGLMMLPAAKALGMFTPGNVNAASPPSVACPMGDATMRAVCAGANTAACSGLAHAIVSYALDSGEPGRCGLRAVSAGSGLRSVAAYSRAMRFSSGDPSNKSAGIRTMSHVCCGQSRTACGMALKKRRRPLSAPSRISAETCLSVLTLPPFAFNFAPRGRINAGNREPNGFLPRLSLGISRKPLSAYHCSVSGRSNDSNTSGRPLVSSCSRCSSALPTGTCGVRNAPRSSMYTASCGTATAPAKCPGLRKLNAPRATLLGAAGSTSLSRFTEGSGKVLSAA